MYGFRTEQSQEYNHSLIQNYNALCEDYNELKSEVQKLYIEGLDSSKYTHKLLNHIDNIAIDEESKSYYSKYEISKNKIIKSHLNKSYCLNNNIDRLFDARKKMLTRRLKTLNIDSIGTTLNIIREFYNDVYIDVERNKIDIIDNNYNYNFNETFTMSMDNVVVKVCKSEIKIKLEIGDY
ncbi:hypothetical protein [Sporosarcina limicola]|uniref:Uncharacterized protein n=1 Tax=Sporosarcina limicola TaxID=34101 RepID=A0A927MLT7_9BACL|nr:hypothetical protein [Sporosarcina limicola]MBE1557090.1 hypothetical protein [Sporosarcina limicola]